MADLSLAIKFGAPMSNIFSSVSGCLIQKLNLSIVFLDPATYNRQPQRCLKYSKINLSKYNLSGWAPVHSFWMNEYDTLFFDFEFGSSPNLEFNEGSLATTIPSPKRVADIPDFDFPSIPTISFDMPYNAKKIDTTAIPIAPEKIKICNHASTPKKRSLIFRPFATFESTELAVNQLKSKFQTKNNVAKSLSF